jgi:CRP/FNR family transcriptional regulator, cyclic AMP receptor protein
VILTGRIKIYNTTIDAREIVLNFLSVGDVNGEIAALDGRERTATAQALETTEVFAIYRRDLIPLLTAHPQALLEIVTVLCEKIRATSEIVEDSQRTMRGRMARGLLRLSRQHGRKTKDGIVIDLAVNQRDLGNYLSLSRENTSRQLAALSEAGVITASGGSIVIKDEAGLTTIAESEME